MEVVPIQQQSVRPKNKPGREMILAGDPNNPTAVPAEEIPFQVAPPARTASVPQPPQPSGSLTPVAAVDPFGEALPEPDATEVLSNLVTSIDRMFSSDTFKNILKTARNQGVFLTTNDPTIGAELKAAKAFLGR